MALWVSLGLLAVAAAVQASPLREPWQALFGLPAIFLAPGLGWARGLGRRAGRADVVRVAFDAFWLSLPAAVAGCALARVAGGGGWTLLAIAAASSLVGGLWERRVSAPKLTWLPSRMEQIGALAAGLMIAVWFGRSAVDIARPLDRYAYLEEREDEEGVAALRPGEGWAEAAALDDGAWRLRPAGSSATLLGPGGLAEGLLLHGPVGARLGGAPGGGLRVEASPIEVADEGPVWRYGDVGVAARWVDASGAAETLNLTFSQPEKSTVYLLPRPSAMWSLQERGELRFVHYYQLLNMVEQLRWAEDRWVTDVQPPLWTWVLAPAIGLTHGGLPTANVLLAGVLGLTALAGILFLRLHAPNAPLAAWLLPGLGAVVTGRLLLEPGSAGMPDGLYAVAIVAGLSGRAVPYGLAAQFLRYPGFVVVLLGTFVTRAWRESARLTGLVLATAAAFALGGLLTGDLNSWLTTVAWESGPEHWHGETDVSVLLGRAPTFYSLWVVYSGGTLLLGALRWPLGTRVALGTALLYSLLLCTIDHTPTHYFVPLVQLSALATACTADSLRSATARHGLAALAAGGLLIFWLRGEILA